MIGFLTDFEGRIYQLPVLLSWDISHALGQPCDAFEVCFAYTPDMADILSAAVRFRAEHEKETVFFGVVDEFEITAGDAGYTAIVRGRSLAALLLDNEAEAAEYYYASPRFMLEKHVYPWGIDRVQVGDLPTVATFSVNSGVSQWRVLEDYAFFCGGIRPRFTKDGILLLDGSDGVRRKIDGTTAVTQQSYRETRYGVISQALVRNRAWGISSTVDNQAFQARGGFCRRVINVPRYTYYDAMRHTGEYQIQRSQEDTQVCTLTLAALFAAFPGDLITLERSPLGINGSFRVTETRCWADGDSAGTTIIMEVQ